MRPQDMRKLMQQAQQMQEQLAAAQDELASASFEGSAGGGVVKATVTGDRLVISDLRMGVEPTYMFNHVVATRGNPHWHAIAPERVRPVINPANLLVFWHRIWSE